MATEPNFTTDKDGKPTYDRGVKIPAWALISAPFVAVVAWLYPRVPVAKTAMILTVLLFEIAGVAVEHASVFAGHWVYNKARIIGVEIFGVPLEEVVIYYFLPVIFVVLIVEWLASRFQSPK